MSEAKKRSSSKKKSKMEMELAEISDDNKNKRLDRMKVQRKQTSLGRSLKLKKQTAEVPESGGQSKFFGEDDDTAVKPIKN